MDYGNQREIRKRSVRGKGKEGGRGVEKKSQNKNFQNQIQLEVAALTLQNGQLREKGKTGTGSTSDRKSSPDREACQK